MWTYFINGENKWYLDMGPIDNYYSLIEEEVTDFLYGNFSCLSKDMPLIIAGVSMGGYGAMYHYLKNTSKYSACIALSPATRPDHIDESKYGSLKDLFLKEKDNIEFLYNSNVTKLNTKDRLESIEVTSNDGKTRTIDVDALFIAIGRIPENQNFAKLINLDNAGYIISNEYCHTNVEGIFVAGDNRVKELRQLVTATSDGAIAAVEAIKYINSSL